MVTRKKAAAAVLMSLAAPACYSVNTVDPGAVVIDDFDDGDLVPAMSELVYWQCYSFNPSTNQDYSCDHTTDEYQSPPFSLYLKFGLADSPDGVQQYPGAGLGAWANGSTVDFTPYRELDISMKLQSLQPPIPSEALVYIELDCKSVQSESGAPTTNFNLTLAVQPSSEWSTYKLALANWAPPPWQTEHIKGGIPACLRAIDGISISMSGQLQDGGTARGKLYIDDLKLR